LKECVWITDETKTNKTEWGVGLGWQNMKQAGNKRLNFIGRKDVMIGRPGEKESI